MHSYNILNEEKENKKKQNQLISEKEMQLQYFLHF